MHTKSSVNIHSFYNHCKIDVYYSCHWYPLLSTWGRECQRWEGLGLVRHGGRVGSAVLPEGPFAHMEWGVGKTVLQYIK